VRRLAREILGVYERVMDAPSAVVTTVGEQFSPTRRLQQPDDYVARIKAVTLDEIVEVWRRYLSVDRVFDVREN
jgi:predicted Zn-dependent peptidase